MGSAGPSTSAARRPRVIQPRPVGSEWSGRGEAQLAAPASEQSLAQAAVRRIAQLGVGGDDGDRLPARLLENGDVTQEVGHPEFGQARLARSEELAGTAQL